MIEKPGVGQKSVISKKFDFVVFPPPAQLSRDVKVYLSTE